MTICAEGVTKTDSLLIMITTGRGLREPAYNIRATRARHGVGAVSSSATCVPLFRATLAFGSGASASAELLRFRPRVPPQLSKSISSYSF